MSLTRLDYSKVGTIELGSTIHSLCTILGFLWLLALNDGQQDINFLAVIGAFYQLIAFGKQLYVSVGIVLRDILLGQVVNRTDYLAEMLMHHVLLSLFQILELLMANLVR